MNQGAASNMEVDPPSTSGVQSGTLKRSNSAPMINMLVQVATSQSAEVSPTSSFKSADAIRMRRLSSSNMGVNSACNLPAPKPTDRINQIKHEENNITDRETAHEKEVHYSWQVTNSWDGLSLTNHDPQSMMSETHRRPRSFSESLHIMTSPSLLCGSPSPTRVIKQCYSPSMRAPVKNNTFTPSPSPSPTRKSFIRSLSPIATQTAPLKRKLESDGGDRYDYLSPPKKFHTGPSTPDRNLPHPLAHSISSSSVEESSPEQTVPRSCLPPGPPAPLPTHQLPHSHPHSHSHPHPATLHHHHHHHHKGQSIPAFMPVAELTDIHMTDSENSDFVEHAEMSDLGKHAGQAGGFTPIHPDRV